MGANIFNDIENVDELRMEHNNRTKQPDFAPGQVDDIFTDNTDIFGTQNNVIPVGTGEDLFSNTGVGSASLVGSYPSQISSYNQASAPMQQYPLSDEDKFFDAVSTGVKTSFNFMSGVIQSIHQTTPRFWTHYGRRTILTSITIVVSGILFLLFGKPDIAIDLVVGALLALGTGVIVLMFNAADAKECEFRGIGLYKDLPKEPIVPEEPKEPIISDDAYDDASDFEYQDNDYEDASSSPSISLEKPFDDNEDDLWNMQLEQPIDVPKSSDEALNEMPVIGGEMVTRSYLYDRVSCVLDSISPGFATVKKYDEDSQEFLVWEKILRDAAEITGVKDEELPELRELSENLFTIKMVCSRLSKSFKDDLIAEEITNMYADEAFDTDEERAKVFTIARVAGKKCTFTVFTGQSKMISLKDMYSSKEYWVKDTENYIPIIIGVDQLGDVKCVDFKKVESCIISGMPRSGKSWLVQAILFQMCCYLSPKELNIYILDPKAGTSDYKQFTLPHVKRFASRYKDSNENIQNPGEVDILDTLREIVNKEAPRRKKLLGDSGCVNIWDFKKKNPLIEIPLIYVVVDEMVTLSAMEKEAEKEYQTYLDQIVTQFPNLGIRGLFIPHEVKNQIISKTAYDAIKCRISVKGSAAHIESSTGTKPRDFRYKLGNVGDMAVKMDEIANGSTIFAHGVALSASNSRNNELFDYMRQVWTKIMPETVKDSVAEDCQAAKDMEVLQKEANEMINNKSPNDFVGVDDLFNM